MSKIDVIDSELHARGCGVRSRFAGIVLVFTEIYSQIHINGGSGQRSTESLQDTLLRVADRLTSLQNSQKNDSEGKVGSLNES